TYGALTIEKALEGRTKFYEPKPSEAAGPDVVSAPAPSIHSTGGATEHRSAPSWPEPVGPDAFHGLAGEVVRTIEPHSEADPAAVLLQFLVAFGNACGRGPGFEVEADRHYTNLNVALVGDTAKGRKGTSFGQARRPVEMADPTWSERVL